MIVDRIARTVDAVAPKIAAFERARRDLKAAGIIVDFVSDIPAHMLVGLERAAAMPLPRTLPSPFSQIQECFR